MVDKIETSIMVGFLIGIPLFGLVARFVLRKSERDVEKMIEDENKQK